MSPIVWSDVRTRRTLGITWTATITMKDDTGASQHILRCSDHSVRLDNHTFVGMVGSWEMIASNFAAFHSDRYDKTLMSLTLAVRSDHGQKNTHTIIDLLNAYRLQGADVVIEFHVPEIPALSAVTMFTGTVAQVESVTRDVISLSLWSENETDEIGVQILRDVDYPNIREDDEGKIIPLVAGELGFNTHFFRHTLGDASLTEDADFKLFNIMAGRPSPCHMIDQELRKVLVSTVPISNATEPGGAEAPGDVPSRLMAMDPNVNGSAIRFPMLATTDYDEANGTIVIPETDTYGFGITEEHDIRLAMCDVPRAYEGGVLDETVANWEDWANAFDKRHLEKFAYMDTNAATSGTAKLSSDRQNFIQPPAGAFYNGGATRNIWKPSDGGQPYVVMIFDYINGTGSADIIYGLLESGGGGVGFTISGPVTEGLQIVKGALSSTNCTNTISDGTWGNTAGDGVFVQFSASGFSGNHFLKVYLLAVMYEVHISAKQLVGKTVIDGRESSPLQFYFTGYACPRTDATPDENGQPLHALKELMIARFGLSSGDFHSSFVATDTNLAISLRATMGYSSATWAIGISVEDEDPFRDVITQINEEVFVNVWKDRNGLWRSKMKEPGPDAGARILTRDNLVQDGLTSTFTSRAEMVNAVYIDFDADESGRTRRSVYIDKTVKGSSDNEGNPDTTREAIATKAQARFGRLERRLKLDWVRDAGCAWDLAVRMFDTLCPQRLKLSALIADGWAFDMEPCDVFTTDASLDDEYRFPGYTGSENEPSWDGEKWWISRIRYHPDGPTIVEAINVD